MSWISIADFRASTKIDDSIISDAIIERALKNADTWIRNNILFKSTNTYSNASNTQDFIMNGLRVSDYYSMDGVIDKNDFKVFEVNNDTKAITDLLSKVDSINEVEGVEDYGVLTFNTGEEYPSSNCTLYIQTFLCKEEWSLMEEDFKRVEEMIAVKYILNTVPVEDLQNGISSWNLNGVSVQTGVSDISSYLEAYEKTINQFKELLEPVYVRRTRAALRRTERVYNDSILNRYGINFK